MDVPISVALIAEDRLGMAVLYRIVNAAGRPTSVVHDRVTHGSGSIRASIGKYAQASRVVPHIVLTDLDTAECPATLRRSWMADALPPGLLLRVAVREIESWVLGDRAGFARLAGIAEARVPRDPEALLDPKQTLIQLVRQGRKRRLIEEIAPARNSRVSIGPLYNERLCAFVDREWDLDSATASCDSLRRCRHRWSNVLAAPTQSR